MIDFVRIFMKSDFLRRKTNFQCCLTLQLLLKFKMLNFKIEKRLSANCQRGYMPQFKKKKSLVAQIAGHFCCSYNAVLFILMQISQINFSLFRFK